MLGVVGVLVVGVLGFALGRATAPDGASTVGESLTRTSISGDETSTSLAMRSHTSCIEAPPLTEAHASRTASCIAAASSNRASRSRTSARSTTSASAGRSPGTRVAMGGITLVAAATSSCTGVAAT